MKLLEGNKPNRTKRTATALRAAESGLAKVLKTTVFLQDIEDFQKTNVALGAFRGARPARSRCPQRASASDKVLTVAGYLYR